MENIPFPIHNGYCTWQLTGDFEDALLEDLLWRKAQYNKDTVSRLLSMIPSQWVDNNDIFYSQDEFVSLHINSFGSYIFRNHYKFNYSFKILENYKSPYVQCPKLNNEAGNYNLFSLISNKLGIDKKEFINRIKSENMFNLTVDERLSYSKKPNWNYKFLQDNDNFDIQNDLKKIFYIPNDFEICNYYKYLTQDKRFAFYIIIIKDTKNKRYYRLPLSNFEYYLSQTTLWDTLFIDAPLPLYKITNINKKNVLICPSESIVESISENHKWITQSFFLTTYANVNKTDWQTLLNHRIFLFHHYSDDECNYNPFFPYMKLRETGIKPYFLQPVAPQERINKINAILTCFLDSNGRFKTYNFDDYLNASQERGFEIPESLLPKAIDLYSLLQDESEPDSEEILIRNMLCLGHQATIFAKRGIGKSLLALVIGLRFAYGRGDGEGIICPSRKYRILLIDGELSINNIRRRAMRLIKGMNLSDESKPLLKIRSSIREKKSLELESPEGWVNLETDMMKADIIIIDSAFKIFPSSMSADFKGASPLNKFYDWCRNHNKTGIVVDHAGKTGGNSPFGTMAKDIGVDLVLSLEKSIEGVKVEVSKNRHFPNDKNTCLTYHINSDESSLKLEMNPEIKAAKSEQVRRTTKAEKDAEREEAIIALHKEQPDLRQGELCVLLTEKKIFGGRSTIQKSIRKLNTEGKISLPS